MQMLTWFIWIFMVGIPAALVLLWIVGMVLQAFDEVKAVEYFAKKYDEVK